MLATIVSTFLAGLLFTASLMASVHILLTKQDVRAAIGWMAIVWVLPGLGAVSYLVLGVNRIRRRAKRRRRQLTGQTLPDKSNAASPSLGDLDEAADPRFQAHAKLAQSMANMPLSSGNALSVLIDGDEAYPAMLKAIDEAKHSIALSTYIYSWDRVGRSFARALKRAVKRGVTVCVLVDAMGSLFVASKLRRLGLDARAFNRPSPAHLAFLNLRTHRKIMVVDGRIGFTGGMNIRNIHQKKGNLALGARDVMICVEGPVVRHLIDIFAEDWRFAGGDFLNEDRWYVDGVIDKPGPAIIRPVPDGPEEETSTAGWIIESALTIAQKKVRIATPYFLPDLGLMGALCQAALRGVEVDILVPERSNWRFVGWAGEAQFEQLLKHGCRIHLSPPPFDHTKMMVVDDYWVMVGSTNWDTRSFRLNFELNLEIYDHETAVQLDALLTERIKMAKSPKLEEVVARPVLTRLRNRAAWLMSPYL